MLAFLQKVLALVLSVTALFSNVFHIRWADGMDGRDFPLISAGEKAEGDIRVMSFNVRCADVNHVPAVLRRHLAVKEVLKIRPDVFGVQEATPTWMSYLKFFLPEYGSVGVARDNGGSFFRKGESNAVFYRKDVLELRDHGDFWLTETPDEPSIYPGAGCNRLCTWALFRVKATGVEFLHFNSHFDHVSQEAREFGAKLILERIGEKLGRLPVVFTADMNVGSENPVYGMMTQTLTDTRVAAKDSVSYGTFHNGSPELSEDWVIDYVLCSDLIDVKAYRTVTDGIEGRFVSDHFPIYADITL